MPSFLPLSGRRPRIVCRLGKRVVVLRHREAARSLVLVSPNWGDTADPDGLGVPRGSERISGAPRGPMPSRRLFPDKRCPVAGPCHLALANRNGETSPPSGNGISQVLIPSQGHRDKSTSSPDCK